MKALLDTIKELTTELEEKQSKNLHDTSTTLGKQAEEGRKHGLGLAISRLKNIIEIEEVLA
jgi:hypothetical protein